MQTKMFRNFNVRPLGGTAVGFSHENFQYPIFIRCNRFR